MQLLWRGSKYDASRLDDYLVSQIVLDIISSIMLKIASHPEFLSGFKRYQFNKGELCKSLENIIERNGVCQQGQNARLAFVPALVSCGILNKFPGGSSGRPFDRPS